MRRIHRIALGGTFLICGLAACAGEETAGGDILGDSMPAAASDSGARAGGARLTVARSAEHGSYLADASGRALYLLEADTGSTSSCHDACATMWPPYLAAGGIPTAAAEGVQAAMLGTIQRPDGTTQITYNGHPLYYYSRDQGAGQTTGQDVTDEWGEWYLVTPQGAALEHHDPRS